MYRDDFLQLLNGDFYFDNAATTYKPRQVIDAMRVFYEKENAYSKHGLYRSSYELNNKIDLIRQKVLDFLGADKNYSVVFTKSATESLNLLAHGLNYSLVALTRLEHHSNILPWRQYCKDIQIIECNRYGKLETPPEADIIAISGMSNILGDIQNLSQTISKAKKNGSTIILDATQMVAHQKVNLKELDVDFAVFSGHKIYGPTGIGVICGKTELLKKVTPLLYGGGAVFDVNDNSFSLRELPDRLEAGTLNSAEIIGLGAALDYQNSKPERFNYESELCSYLEKKLTTIPNLDFIGSGGVYSFRLNEVHPHDIASILDTDKICVRAGYHCAEPLLTKLNYGPCARISIGIYNTSSEIDYLVEKISTIRKRMGL